MKILIAALVLVCAAGIASAAEIKVLSGGAIEPGLKAAAAAFSKETGHQVAITFNTTPQIRKRIGGGEIFDVVIAPPAAIDEFSKAGKIEGERVNVGRVGLGVTVRPGAPTPDVSTSEAVRKTVLEAESIVFNRASTGIYFENLLKKWGIYDQVESKAARYTTGAEVMHHVLKGKGREVGFGPITEILLEKDKGLVLVGPLPADVQNYTSYLAATMSGASSAEVGRAFVRFLGGPVGKPLFVAAGIE